jgi:hypothetical protein
VEICHDQSLVYSAIRLACVQENCQAEEFVYPMGVKMIAGKVKMQKLFLNDNIFRNNAKSLVCTVRLRELVYIESKNGHNAKLI